MFSLIQTSAQWTNKGVFTLLQKRACFAFMVYVLCCDSSVQSAARRAESSNLLNCAYWHFGDSGNWERTKRGSELKPDFIMILLIHFISNYDYYIHKNIRPVVLLCFCYGFLFSEHSFLMSNHALVLQSAHINFCRLLRVGMEVWRVSILCFYLCEKLLAQH